MQWRNFNLGLGGVEQKKFFCHFFSYTKNDVSVDPQRVAMELLVILKPGRTSDLMAHFFRARNLVFRSYVTTDHSLNPG